MRMLILCVNECVNDWWISSCDTNLVFDENAGILHFEIEH